MSIKTEPTDLGGIIDIEPPLLPIETGAEFTLLVVSVLILTVLGIYIILRQRTLRSRARKQLNHLKTAYAHQSIDTRTAAYRIAATLRIGLQLQQLSSQTGIPSHLNKHRQRWETFIERLYALRYTPDIQIDENISALFREADFWLKSWR